MSNKRKVSDEQRQEIVARYKNGERRKDLAREYNVSLQLICNIIAMLTHGESFRDRQGPGEALTKKQKEWAYEQYCNGYTQSEIADALFCDTVTVWRAINRRPRIKKPLHYDSEKEGA
jgi:predicted transcriptional regulator